MDKDAKQIKEAVRTIWNNCFSDSTEFTDLYFEKRYREDTNIYLVQDETIISAFQMIPYPMTYLGEKIETSYVSGAGTLPEYRSQGAMTQLLGESFKKMKENNIQFSTLIPSELSLFDYYGKLGYTRIFDYAITDIDLSSVSDVKGYEIEEYTDYREDVYEYFNRKMEERPCCIQHTADDFEFITAAAALENEPVYIARQNMQVKGILFAELREDGLMVKELLAESDFAKEALLYQASQWAGTTCIRYRDMPRQGESDYALGMARAIDVHLLLNTYAHKHPELELTLKITDEFLPENNGYYRLSEGECIRYTDKPDRYGYTFVTINQLTQALLGYHTEELPEALQAFEPQVPYMSLMVD